MQQTQYTPAFHDMLDDGRAFALYQGKPVTRGNLWADVKTLAAALPERPYMVNLCTNRYLFCVSLLAAAWRGQTCLLPASAQKGAVEELVGDYPGAYLATERDLRLQGMEWFKVDVPDLKARAEPPRFNWQRTAVVAFTSGSTGKPKPCPHNLLTFKVSAQMALHSLGLAGQKKLVVSTTPPQHMYGLETSVFWPLFSDLVLHDGRPFFPEDVRQVVGSSPWPVVLASTPTHLRALATAHCAWGQLAAVISATDVLPEKLADKAVQILGNPLYEIYGSTETLSFAYREPLRSKLWTPYVSARLSEDDTGAICLHSPHLPLPMRLQDHFALEADGRFLALGRPADMLKIGGKRASLAELNRRLKEIDGVEDGFCFVQQQGADDGRVVAVVVGQVDKATVRDRLALYIDEVFLPRKVYVADTLPRNDVGKLSQMEIGRLLASLDAADNGLSH